MVMNWHMNSAAKRLTFSLLAASALGGCAVYEPYNPDGATYAGDAYPYGQSIYSSTPYYYAPYYVAPSTSFGFRFESDRRRHHGILGDRPGFRRDGLRGGRDGLPAGERRHHPEGRVGDGGRVWNRVQATPPPPLVRPGNNTVNTIRERRARDGGR
jgi:hypothetical protein